MIFIGSPWQKAGTFKQPLTAITAAADSIAVVDVLRHILHPSQSNVYQDLLLHLKFDWAQKSTLIDHILKVKKSTHAVEGFHPPFHENGLTPHFRHLLACLSQKHTFSRWSRWALFVRISEFGSLKLSSDWGEVIQSKIELVLVFHNLFFNSVFYVQGCIALLQIKSFMSSQWQMILNSLNRTVAW